MLMELFFQVKIFLVDFFLNWNPYEGIMNLHNNNIHNLTILNYHLGILGICIILM